MAFVHRVERYTVKKQEFILIGYDCKGVDDQIVLTSSDGISYTIARIAYIDRTKDYVNELSYFCKQILEREKDFEKAKSLILLLG